jgi:hypothetical protein
MIYSGFQEKLMNGSSGFPCDMIWLVSFDIVVIKMWFLLEAVI